VDILQIAAILLGVIALSGLVAMMTLVFKRPSKASATVRGLMPSMSAGGMEGVASRSKLKLSVEEINEEAMEAIRARIEEQGSKPAEDISSKLFRAGYYTTADKEKFVRIQIILPIVLAIILGLGAQLATSDLTLSGGGLFAGIFIGYTGPLSWLDRKIRKRNEEILYYLPLVVEQITIAVSSSLDIGPCVNLLLEMANTRDCHNAVTEVLMHVEKLMRSGMSLEESLVEVAEAHGQPELKHCFLFLSQCAKHGGELSKQLQELGDAVAIQRQLFIEGKISQLPVKATGPLALVFGGFFGLLFAGLFVRISIALQQK